MPNQHTKRKAAAKAEYELLTGEKLHAERQARDRNVDCKCADPRKTNPNSSIYAAQQAEQQVKNRQFSQMSNRAASVIGLISAQAPTPMGELTVGLSRLDNAIGITSTLADDLRGSLARVLKGPLPPSAAESAGTPKPESPIGQSLAELTERVYGIESTLRDILHRIAI